MKTTGSKQIRHYNVLKTTDSTQAAIMFKLSPPSFIIYSISISNQVMLQKDKINKKEWQHATKSLTVNSFYFSFFGENPSLNDKVELSACWWILLPQQIVVVSPCGHENQVT